MNQEALSFSLTQINYLVSTLKKKNFDQNSRQIESLVKPFGLEADRHLLRCLFSSVDFTEANNQTAKKSLQARLLKQELNTVLSKSSLITNICFAIDNCFIKQKTLKPSPNLFSQLFKALNCSPILEVVISLALTYSKNPEFVRLAENQLKVCLPSLIQSYVELDTNQSTPEGGLSDISPELLQLVLSLLSHDKYKNYDITELTYKKFITQISGDFPRERCPLILAPLIYRENTEISAEKMSANSQGILTTAIMDTSWPNLVMDIGYAFTASKEECKNHLTKFSGRELSAQDVAKIIALMCRTHENLSELSINLPNPSTFWPSTNNDSASGGQDSGEKNHMTEHTAWKPDVFVQALMDVVPTMNWKEICIAFDHGDFIIKDRGALVLLMTIVELGMQTSGGGKQFPVDIIYRMWTNTQGQLSLIGMILKSPDVYSFADNIFKSVAIESFKVQPENDSKEIIAWRSIHLIEILLFIAEKGYYPQVLEHFKVPMQHCPDILFMALLQIGPPMTVLVQEMFQSLLPIFFGTHPNSIPILSHAWNSTKFNNFSLRHIINHSMSDWYVRGGATDNVDQTRLIRILDLANELGSLSSLLNVRSFQFVIDLAVAASRREFLKLDKYLTEKIRENGEQFVQSIISYLQRRCPQITGAKILDDHLTKVSQLPHEILSTIINCLQPCIGNVQQDLNDAIVQLTTNCNILLNKQRQQQQQQQHQQQQQLMPLQGLFRRSIDTNLMSSVAGSNFGGPSMDSISGLSSNLAGMNLSGPSTGGSFNFNTNLMNNLVTTPASPSHLLQQVQPNSPFQMPPMPLGSGLRPPVNNNIGRIPVSPSSDKVNIAAITTNNPSFSENTPKATNEIEEEANGYFIRIYNHSPHESLSIDEVLDILQRFSKSTVEREREVQQCMVRNLFEEYRFFHEYPDKELQITAELFGGIIERNLVPTVQQLGIALRYVLEALRKPEGSKMYHFGITSLDRFKSRLYMYSDYCEHVQQIPTFNKFPAHLIEYVKFGIDGSQPPNKPQGPTPLAQANAAALYRSSSETGKNAYTTPTKASKTAQTFTGTNLNTLLVANSDRCRKIIHPPSAVQDKTAFIFNNLSVTNVPDKCAELKKFLTKDFFPWLSQYMVLKRVSIELNFHTVYSNLLDELKNQEIIELVTDETFRNIRVLLSSDKGIENFSDRSLLKNLGHWLGVMTLGRNRPILHIDLDLKSLLLEAYHRGQQDLMYVVPFVAKILESCAKGKVFKPPNPWTMGLMNVLGELHQEPDLKLNLKFEIEVLCKTLSIEVADLKPGIYLRDPERFNNIEHQLSVIKKEEQKKSPIPQIPQIPIQPQIPTESPNQNSEIPEAKFNFNDISIGNIKNLAQHLVFSPNLSIFHTHQQLKAVVQVAIERSISECLVPVVERSVRIAVTTCEQIMRKDFALDPDETEVRKAAHYMVRNLSAGMSMITCRDSLNQVIQKNIVASFAQSMLMNAHELNEMAIQIANDNTELTCVFIQKTATEKAVAEVEKRLAADFDARKAARQEGRRHYDASVLTYQTTRMPEPIRLKVGDIPSEHFTVYEAFGRNIPGFQPMTDRDAAILYDKTITSQTTIPTFASVTESNPIPATAPPMSSGNEMGSKLDELIARMDAFVASVNYAPGLLVHMRNTRALVECIMAAKRANNELSTVNLINRAVDNIFECVTTQTSLLKTHYRALHLDLLTWMNDERAYGPKFTQQFVTMRMIDCREDIRYNLEAVELLLATNLANVLQYDCMLSTLLDSGNFLAISFSMQLMQRLFVDDRQKIRFTEKDFTNTIETLSRLSTMQRSPEGLPHLIEMLRMSTDAMGIDRVTTGPTSHIHSGISQVRSIEFNDPGMAEKVEFLLKDWANNYHVSASGSRDAKSFSSFVNKLNLYGVLKTDELITRFFTKATQWCIELSRNLHDPTASSQQNKAKVFHYIDAFIRLIALIVKYSGDNPNSATKINLLNKILGIIVGVLLHDQEQHGTSFQQLGYHRFFIMLFLELSAPELESISLSVSTAFCHTYHILRPSVAPGFCYSWLELISHRVFIGRVLALTPQQKGWAMYSQLILDLFRYLAPFLRNAELAKPVQLLYKGTLRVLLVLLHDFPEFLGDYHFAFCDVIPSNCIQLRNLVLAAFPRNMRLPDPFTPNLKVDMLNDITASPRVFANFVSNIQPTSFKNELDSYLKARAPVTFLSELRGRLQVSNTSGSKYNTQLMNALVLYVGTQAIDHIRSKNLVPNMTTIVHCSHMDIFQNLIVDLDHEGRYLFLNAVANQLRYPNSHTHYFSCTLLYLFVEANSEAIQEQITRVLLERLIVNRPHPWGLLITFIELIKNPIYKFWEHDFVHCAPEIEKLFESVARSCMVKTSGARSGSSQQPGNEIQECN
ncbi:CCR4-NOT transcription complex subunit 1-like [Contarinia nasturtii]|uniref:CCR4-NOT transcription complex subunit 1-like n=1 Tax=Contarinia nasturtii TaxID=265458 RepID=UPI0012D4986E|nr:CCR4-NOT transcription complex subunit 1-like [Contarinia nasturtii]